MGAGGLGGGVGRVIRNIKNISRYWSRFQQSSTKTFNRLQSSSKFQNRVAKMSDKQLNKAGNNWNFAMLRYRSQPSGSGKSDGARAGVLQAYRAEAARRGISTTHWGEKHIGNNPIKNIGSVKYTQ